MGILPERGEGGVHHRPVLIGEDAHVNQDWPVSRTGKWCRSWPCRDGAIRNVVRPRADANSAQVDGLVRLIESNHGTWLPVA